MRQKVSRGLGGAWLRKTEGRWAWSWEGVALGASGEAMGMCGVPPKERGEEGAAEKG